MIPIKSPRKTYWEVRKDGTGDLEVRKSPRPFEDGTPRNTSLRHINTTTVELAPEHGDLHIRRKSLPDIHANLSSSSSSTAAISNLPPLEPSDEYGSAGMLSASSGRSASQRTFAKPASELGETAEEQQLRVSGQRAQLSSPLRGAKRLPSAASSGVLSMSGLDYELSSSGEMSARTLAGSRSNSGDKGDLPRISKAEITSESLSSIPSVHVSHSLSHPPTLPSLHASHDAVLPPLGTSASRAAMLPDDENLLVSPRESPRVGGSSVSTKAKANGATGVLDWLSEAAEDAPARASAAAGLHGLPASSFTPPEIVMPPPAPIDVPYIVERRRSSSSTPAPEVAGLAPPDPFADLPGGDGSGKPKKSPRRRSNSVNSVGESDEKAEPKATRRVTKSGDRVVKTSTGSYINYGATKIPNAPPPPQLLNPLLIRTPADIQNEVMTKLIIQRNGKPEIVKTQVDAAGLKKITNVLLPGSAAHFFAAPPFPNELERVAVLKRYKALDEHLPSIDRIVLLARRMFMAPIGGVTLITKDELDAISLQGIDSYNASRDAAFCPHAFFPLSAQEPPGLLYVPDATLDCRFACNPWVTGPLAVRFYAGVCLRSPEGIALGTLFLMDQAPHELEQEDFAALRDLGTMVERELEALCDARVNNETADMCRRLLTPGMTSQQALRLTVERVQSVLQVYVVQVLKYKFAQQTFVRKMQVGTTKDKRPDKDDLDAANWLLKSGESVSQRQTQTFSKKLTNTMIGSLIHLSNAEIYGVLLAQKDGSGHVFTQAELNFISTVASALGSSLQPKLIERRLQMQYQESERYVKALMPFSIGAVPSAEDPQYYVERYTLVTIMVVDIYGFDKLSERMTPEELLDTINTVFAAFDALVEKKGLQRIKTIGDAFIVAGGVPHVNSKHAVDCVELGFDMHQKAQQLSDELRITLNLRIGVATGGPIVTGIIGRGHSRKAFDIWGEVVNTASFMKYFCDAGGIRVSGSTFHYLDEKVYEHEPMLNLYVRGIGRIASYLINGRKDRNIQLRVAASDAIG